VWFKANGEIPDGLQVLHRCDNPPCHNIDHLFLGTHADNMADKKQKGRVVAPVGEDNGQAKLVTADVLAIRRLRGVRTQRVLAKEFGVSQHTICAVQRRESWGHVAAA
jgi:hypothetical protein